jgi:hypothetical protein
VKKLHFLAFKNLKKLHFLHKSTIKETVSEGLIKPFDAETSQRYMKYIPGWA